MQLLTRRPKEQQTSLITDLFDKPDNLPSEDRQWLTRLAYAISSLKALQGKDKTVEEMVKAGMGKTLAQLFADNTDNLPSAPDIWVALVNEVDIEVLRSVAEPVMKECILGGVDHNKMDGTRGLPEKERDALFNMLGYSSTQVCQGQIAPHQLLGQLTVLGLTSDRAALINEMSLKYLEPFRLMSMFQMMGDLSQTVHFQEEKMEDLAIAVRELTSLIRALNQAGGLQGRLSSSRRPPPSDES